MPLTKCSEETRQELWELLYDLLPAEQAETLRAKITSDPAVARAYSEVKLRVDLLAAASKRDEALLSLGVPGEKSGCAADRSAASAGNISAAAGNLSRVVNALASLAALLLVALAGFGYLQYGAPWKVAAAKVERGELALNYVRTVVAGPQTVAPETANYYSVNTTTLDGEPVSTEVAYRLVDANGRAQVEKVQRTDDNGWSRFSVPGALVADGTVLWVETPNEVVAGSVNGALHTLADNAQLGQVDDSTRWYFASRVVDARAPLEIQLNNPTSNNLVVTAQNGGRQVGRQTVTSPASTAAGEPPPVQDSRLALPLSTKTSGATRVTLYDFTTTPPTPLAEHYLFVAPTNQLNISRENESDAYTPGQEAELHFQVYDNGQPAAVKLRVAVIEESALLAWGRSSDFGENEMALSYSVPLGNLPARPESNEPLLVSDTPPESTPLLVLDNSETVQAAYQSALAETDGRRESRLRWVGRFCLVGGAVLLGGLILAAWLRVTRSLLVLAPVLAAAAGCMLVGLLWTSARVDKHGDVAFAGFAVNDRQPDATQRPIAKNNLRGIEIQSNRFVQPKATEPYHEDTPGIHPADPSAAPTSSTEGRLAGIGTAAERTPPAGGEGKLGDPIVGKGGGDSSGTSSAPSGGSGSPQSNFHVPLQQPGTPRPSSYGMNGQGLGGVPGGTVTSAGQIDREALAVPMLYSNLHVSTGEDGQATVRIKLPESPGVYRVFVEGRSGDRLGLYRGKFETRAVNAAATTPVEAKPPEPAKPAEPKREPPNPEPPPE